MAHIGNEQSHKLLARAVGVGLLAAFGVAMYQSMAAGSGTLVAAAEEGSDALAQALRVRMLLDSAMVGLTIFVAVGFYLLLRPVDASVALFASALRLVGGGFTAYGVYAANALGADLIGGQEGTLPAAVEGLNALNFDLFHWSLIASSVAAAANYALLFAGRFMPRILAGYGVLASLGATVGASAIYLAPPLSEVMYPAYVAANALAFISLTLWLLIFGVNVRHWNARG